LFPTHRTTPLGIAGRFTLIGSWLSSIQLSPTYGTTLLGIAGRFTLGGSRISSIPLCLTFLPTGSGFIAFLFLLTLSSKTRDHSLSDFEVDSASACSVC
jgi:hypothetical protein